jgi:hypothetical protein
VFPDHHTERLAEAGASVSYGKALAETLNGLYKAELASRPAEYEAVYYDQHNIPVAPAGAK